MVKRSEQEATGPIGGVVFFVSLLVCTFLAVVFFGTAPWILPAISGERAFLCLSGLCVGGWIAHRLIQGSLSVFLHELKHSILSNLSGNKDRGMIVRRNSGEFRYAFSKATAHMNAFISLAPYCFPLATVVFLPTSMLLFGSDMPVAALLIGIGAGIDLVLNARDISWYQTDLSEVRGGYPVSLWYILAWNVALWSVIIGFALAGMPALRIFLSSLTQVVGSLFGVSAHITL